MLISNKQINIILFFIILLFVSTSLKGQKNNDYNSIKTVVIDAGHGGKDPGALSKNKKVKEKDITLSVALKLGNLIKANYPEIKVVYTRKTDVYVNLSERANIANKNKADLFISIHVNATKSTQPRGTETFVWVQVKVMIILRCVRPRTL
jgi:N-acetylmuramoyl-L-alanine amidase